MKKLLRILAYTLGVIAVLVLGFAGYVQWKFNHLPELSVRPLPIKAVTDSAVIAHGAKVVTTLCAGCHLGDDGALSGHLFMGPETGFGTLWSANITQHPEKGIGRYTDGELAFTIRTGITRDARFLGPFMQHPLISDADLTAIVSFLRAESRYTRPVDVARPPADYSFIAKALISFSVFDPAAPNPNPVPSPDTTDHIAYGKYLVDAFYMCSNCHSASFETNDPLFPEKSVDYLAGGNPVPDQQHTVITNSANITPHKLNGIGNWTYDQFIQAVREGKKPSQDGLSPAMPRFTLISDAEMKAIWAFLQTVPAVDKKVIPGNQKESNTKN